MLVLSPCAATQIWCTTGRWLSKVIDIFETGSFWRCWHTQRHTHARTHKHGIPRETSLIVISVQLFTVMWFFGVRTLLLSYQHLSLSCCVAIACRLTHHHGSFQGPPHLHYLSFDRCYYEDKKTRFLPTLLSYFVTLVKKT